MTSFLDYLKESPNCLYIYDLNETIYGLPNKNKYVVKDDWVCPEDWIGFDSKIFRIFHLQQWFNCITNGDLIGWECACLNKKYVIKEHVKLLMTTNPLQLRKHIDSILKTDTYDPKDLIRSIKFSIQIIDNHKIVNYKDGLDDIISSTLPWDIILKDSFAIPLSNNKLVISFNLTCSLLIKYSFVASLNTLLVIETSS